MTQYRNCAVTFNNYPEDFDPAVFQQICKYYVMGKEISKTKTPHLQCYLEFNGPTRKKRIQALFRSKVHVERRHKKSTPLQASNYCKKGEGEDFAHQKNPDFVEYGTLSTPGKRNDIHKLRQAVQSGSSLLTLYNEHDAMYKYHRAAKDHRLQLQMQDKKFTPMQIICLYGPAGAGKTRASTDQFPDIFHVPSVNPLWFDGYDGEETILIDDFYGAMDYSQLLKILDGYRFSVPIKGGFVWKQWTRVIITSNRHPNTWYPHHDFSALERRFDLIESRLGSSITPTSVPLVKSWKDLCTNLCTKIKTPKC